MIGVNTPRIEDASTKDESIYILELKKYDIDIEIVIDGNYNKAYWYDGEDKYNKLSDYNWDYSEDVILRAVFENVQPKPQPSNGSGSSGSDGSTINGNKKVEQKINVIHIQNNKFIKFATSNDKIKWLHDQTANLWGMNFINGAWYYFGPDGKMFYDTITPDGYRVDKDGKWIQ